jgi:hypothetical protein
MFWAATDDFDELCFEFGIELDDDTTEEVEAARQAGIPTPPPQLKIEMPANRYDLLCIEGLARALRVFLEKDKAPKYALSAPAVMQEVFVETSVSRSSQERTFNDWISLLTMVDFPTSTILCLLRVEASAADEPAGIRVFPRSAR